LVFLRLGEWRTPYFGISAAAGSKSAPGLREQQQQPAHFLPVLANHGRAAALAHLLAFLLRRLVCAIIIAKTKTKW
jgi:hypothetical protein